MTQPTTRHHCTASFMLAPETLDPYFDEPAYGELWLQSTLEPEFIQPAELATLKEPSV